MHIAFEVLLLLGGLQLITATVGVHSSGERKNTLIYSSLQLRGSH